MGNIRKIQKALPESVDAILLLSEANQRYATGFGFTDGAVLVGRKAAYLITDSRYVEAAREACDPAAEVVLTRNDLRVNDWLGKLVEELEIKTLGIEENVISYAEYMRFQELLPCKLESAQSVMQDLRAGKSPEELETMTAALSRQLQEDVRRLCLYLDKKDAETLRFYLRRPGHMSPEEARRWWHDGGVQSAGLRRIAGAEADALNLVYILRLRTFPASVDRAEELLIPVRDKLTPDLVQRILRADSDKRVLELLRGTPWSSSFQSLAPGDLEKQYSAYMAAFCQRVLNGARPGLVAGQAFLTLKEMDRQRLTRLVSAVSKGIDPNLVA